MAQRARVYMLFILAPHGAPATARSNSQLNTTSYAFTLPLCAKISTKHVHNHSA